MARNLKYLQVPSSKISMKLPLYVLTKDVNARKQYNTTMYVNIVLILYWRCLQPTLLSHLWNRTCEEGGGGMQWGTGGMFACSYIHCTCTQVLTVHRFWMQKQSVFDVECGNGGRYCASFQRVTYKDGNIFSRTFKGTVHCKKKVSDFSVPSRDVIYQTLSGREQS